jgi:hypothetical protein
MVKEINNCFKKYNFLPIYLIIFQVIFTILLGLFGSYDKEIHINIETVPQLYAS